MREPLIEPVLAFDRFLCIFIGEDQYARKGEELP
jgi:hypothetical protein